MSGPSDGFSEAEEFMALFAELRKRCCDRPEDLEELAAANADILNLCRDLNAVAQKLQASEMSDALAYTSPTSPVLVNAWRSYNWYYGIGVFRAVLFGDGNVDMVPNTDAFGPEFKWQTSALEAMRMHRDLMIMRYFAEEHQLHFDEDARAIRYKLPTIGDLVEGQIGIYCEDSESKAEFDGADTWYCHSVIAHLTETVGLDPKEAIRRRMLLPFVLVPRHVAARQGASHPGTMLTSLEEAHRAFVFGASFAALAMMRSIIEVVLRDEYKIRDGDLKDRIETAREILPPGCSAESLHQIRMMANATLHANPHGNPGTDRLNRLVNSGDQEFELEMVRLMGVLRALIEGAEAPGGHEVL